MSRMLVLGLIALLVGLAGVAQGQVVDRDSPLSELDFTLESLNDVRVDISSVQISDKRRPPDLSEGLFAETVGQPLLLRRQWPTIEFNWAAANVYHQPLYFNDTPLERYGQTRHPALQPWISGARFFMTFPVVPYLMGVDRPFDHIYVLGHYWPGSPTPSLRQRPPLELDAAAFESAAWVALVLALP